MVPIPSHNVDQIKQRIDIVDLIQSYVRLEKAGVNFRARCPFHQERTPSFYVSPSRQTWRCFGCQKGGDHFSFIEEIEGLEFLDALKLLADRAGITLVREDKKSITERMRLHAICEEAARFFESTLHDSETPERASPMLQYLFARGLTRETIASFRIGYAPDAWDGLLLYLTRKGFGTDDIEKAGLVIKKEEPSDAHRRYYDRYRNRIIFPIADSSGRVIAFGGRIFDERQKAGGGERETAPAKYINSPETPIYNKSKTLYAFDKAKQRIRKENACILVEGYMDAVMAHQAGMVNTVAVSGTALTSDHIRMITRLAKTILLSFDMDSAGQRATERSLELPEAALVEKKIILLPSGKDPADAVRENPQIFIKAVGDARPLMDYYFQKAITCSDPETPQGKKEAAAFFLPHLRRLANDIERAHWIQALSGAIGVPEASIRSELDKLRVPRPERQIPSGAAPGQKARCELLEERLVSLRMHDPALCETILKEYESPVPFATLQLERLWDALAAGSSPVPPELESARDRISFQLEFLQSGAFEPADEIRTCLRSIFAAHYQEKMADTERRIRALEKIGDRDRIRELLAEFAKASERLRSYTA